MHGRKKVIPNKMLGAKSIQNYRYRPGVATLGGKMYVLGGEEGWDRYHDTIGKITLLVFYNRHQNMKDALK